MPLQTPMRAKNPERCSQSLDFFLSQKALDTYAAGLELEHGVAYSGVRVPFYTVLEENAPFPFPKERDILAETRPDQKIPIDELKEIGGIFQPNTVHFQYKHVPTDHFPTDDEPTSIRYFAVVTPPENLVSSLPPIRINSKSASNLYGLTMEVAAISCIPNDVLNKAVQEGKRIVLCQGRLDGLTWEKQRDSVLATFTSIHLDPENAELVVEPFDPTKENLPDFDNDNAKYHQARAKAERALVNRADYVFFLDTSENNI